MQEKNAGADAQLPLNNPLSWYGNHCYRNYINPFVRVQPALHIYLVKGPPLLNTTVLVNKFQQALWWGQTATKPKQEIWFRKTVRPISSATLQLQIRWQSKNPDRLVPRRNAQHSGLSIQEWIPRTTTMAISLTSAILLFPLVPRR